MSELVLDYIKNRMVEISNEQMYGCCKRRLLDELLDLNNLLEEGRKNEEQREAPVPV